MRVRNLVRNVQRLLSDTGGRQATKELVVASLNDEEKKLCRDLYALPFMNSFTLKTGQGIYEGVGGLYRVTEFVAPQSWRNPLQFVVNPKVWAYAVRTYSGGQPMYVFVYDRKLNLHPVPSTDGEVLTIIGYALPDADMQFDGDPSLKEEWDDALIFGTALRLFADPAIKKVATGFNAIEVTKMYEDAKLSASTTKETDGIPNTISHSSELIGF